MKPTALPLAYLPKLTFSTWDGESQRKGMGESCPYPIQPLLPLQTTLAVIGKVLVIPCNNRKGTLILGSEVLGQSVIINMN